MVVGGSVVVTNEMMKGWEETAVEGEIGELVDAVEERVFVPSSSSNQNVESAHQGRFVVNGYPLSGIVGLMEQVDGRKWVEFEAGDPGRRYDLRLEGVDCFAQARAAMERELGLVVNRVKMEEDVLVVKLGADGTHRLKKLTEDMGWITVNGNQWHFKSPISGSWSLCTFMADEFDLVLVDETGLRGSFEFQIPVRGGMKFDEYVALFEKTTGLILERDRRTLSKVVVRSVEDRIYVRNWSGDHGQKANISDGDDPYVDIYNNTVGSLVSTAYGLRTDAVLEWETAEPGGKYDVNLEGEGWRDQMAEALEDEMGLVGEWVPKMREIWVIKGHDGEHAMKMDDRGGQSMSGNDNRFELKRCSIKSVEAALMHAMDSWVVHEGDLTGRYTLVLDWNDADSEAEKVAVFEKATGLELVKEMREIEVLVVRNVWGEGAIVNDWGFDVRLMGSWHGIDVSGPEYDRDEFTLFIRDDVLVLEDSDGSEFYHGKVLNSGVVAGDGDLLGMDVLIESCSEERLEGTVAKVGYRLTEDEYGGAEIMMTTYDPTEEIRPEVRGTRTWEFERDDVMQWVELDDSWVVSKTVTVRYDQMWQIEEVVGDVVRGLINSGIEIDGAVRFMFHAADSWNDPNEMSFDICVPVDEDFDEGRLPDGDGYELRVIDAREVVMTTYRGSVMGTEVMFEQLMSQVVKAGKKLADYDSAEYVYQFVEGMDTKTSVVEIMLSAE